MNKQFKKNLKKIMFADSVANLIRSLSDVFEETEEEIDDIMDKAKKYQKDLKNSSSTKYNKKD